MGNNNHHAVDFDGTLSIYNGWKGIDHLGPPVPEMLEKVKKWLSNGERVTIFTARAHSDISKRLIQDWLEANGLPRLNVTNIKRPEFTHFWDDGAERIIKNKGISFKDFYFKNLEEHLMDDQIIKPD